MTSYSSPRARWTSTAAPKRSTTSASGCSAASTEISKRASSGAGAGRRQPRVLEDHARTERRLGDLPHAVLTHRLPGWQHVVERIARQHQLELGGRTVRAGAAHLIDRDRRLLAARVAQPGGEDRSD